MAPALINAESQVEQGFKILSASGPLTIVRLDGEMFSSPMDIVDG